MKRKLSKLWIILGLVLILGGTAWVSPRALSLYYQVQGGRLLNHVLSSINISSSSSFICNLPPINDHANVSILKTARNALQKANFHNPGASQAYAILGRINCLLGDPEVAVAAYKNYINLRPQNPLGHIELGFAYQAAGYASEAVNEWKITNLGINDFIEARREALKNQQYQLASKWLEDATLMSGSEPDILSGIRGTQPFILDNFITSDLWQPCSWCQNTAGTYETRKGILEIAYQNVVNQRSGYSIFTEPDIPIKQFHELLLRLEGKPGTFLTIDVMQDGVRSRPISYLEAPGDWSIWTIPINGTVLNEILLGIRAPSPLPNSEKYQVSVDWIGLR